MSTLHIAVVDVGSPKQSNLGWAIGNSQSTIINKGDDLAEFVKKIDNLLKNHPVALGFECPLFVPSGLDWKTLTNARRGECDHRGNRPWSASAGACSMATGLVQASYVLRHLKNIKKISLDWQPLPANHGELLVFEAFVSGQGKPTNVDGKNGSHQEDATYAVKEFCNRIDNQHIESDVTLENGCDCLSIIGAILLHAGVSKDVSLLHKKVLVIKT